MSLIDCHENVFIQIVQLKRSTVTIQSRLVEARPYAWNDRVELVEEGRV